MNCCWNCQRFTIYEKGRYLELLTKHIEVHVFTFKHSYPTSKCFEWTRAHDKRRRHSLLNYSEESFSAAITSRSQPWKLKMSPVKEEAFKILQLLLPLLVTINARETGHMEVKEINKSINVEILLFGYQIQLHTWLLKEIEHSSINHIVPIQHSQYSQ